MANEHGTYKSAISISMSIWTQVYLSHRPSFFDQVMNYDIQMCSWGSVQGVI